MRKFITILFCFITACVVGQKAIKGKIVDGKTGKPIEFATIYVNGTSIGTISNAVGQFVLTGFSPPGRIVFSHVGYKTREINGQEYLGKAVSISLEPRAIDITAITVPERNKREENLQLFRKEFLGDDYWGKNAKITNEYALTFNWTYEKKQLQVFSEAVKQKLLQDNKVKWADDSLWAETNFPLNLNVSASEPLQVELPLLGYVLHIDLLEFNYTYNKRLKGFTCGLLGYYYFKLHAQQKARSKISDNRSKAWYHSPQHFCRSLYQQQLKQNGYRIVKEVKNAEGKIQYHRILLDSLLTYQKGFGQLAGLNQQKLHILWFHNRKGLPVSAGQHKARNPLQSSIYFQSDTCLIRADGIVPDNNIMFTPVIGAKKVGASLPANFLPQILNP